MVEPPHPALAQGKVAPRRRSGRDGRSPTTKAAARAAAALVDIDYDVLPGRRPARRCDRAGRAAGVGRGARATSASTGTSAIRRRPTPRSRRPRTSSSSSSTNNRVAPNAMEPRAANGHYDARERSLHAVHHVAEPAPDPAADGARSRCTSPSTSCASSRPTSAAASARRSSTTPRSCSSCGRRSRSAARSSGPRDRSEAFISDAHGRDHISQGAARARRERQVPRPARPHATRTSARTCRRSRRRCRRTSTRRCCRGRTTSRRSTPRSRRCSRNTVPVDAYRGAGRPEAAYLLERLVDKAARQIGIDRDRAAPART